MTLLVPYKVRDFLSIRVTIRFIRTPLNQSNLARAARIDKQVGESSHSNSAVRVLNLNSVNQLIFVMVKCGVLFEVRTEFLNNI
jgi:hypothetical protein